jgi:ElaB/YqjD/DUF883 family membrane-anchored ribosome-binding protein
MGKDRIMETMNEVIERTSDTSAQERLMSDLKALGRDVEDLLRSTTGDMGVKAGEARARLGIALERVRSTCREVSRQTAVTAKAAAKKADTTIREHPYESIGVALGVGLLAGVLIMRR